MTTLSDIIARLEKAAGPDSKLGREVLLACGWRQTYYGHLYGPLYQWSSPCGRYSFKDDDFDQFDPTRSIDAALTLVPEGWVRCVDATAPDAGVRVDLYPPIGRQPVAGDHKKEAVATCIAALKALETIRATRSSACPPPLPSVINQESEG